MRPLMPPEETTRGEIRQVVVSPEQVTLHLPLAGPTSRMTAYGIDFLLVVLLDMGVAIVLLLTTPVLEWLRDPAERLLEKTTQARPGEGFSPEMLAAIALFVLFSLVVEWVYFTFFELTTGGRSPGKMVVGLRVVRDGGMPLTARASFIRNILRTVDMLPMNYAVGLVAMIASAEGKRLGDIAAGTVVIRHDRPESVPPLADIPPAAVPAFRFDRAQIEKLGADELTLIRLTLRRAATLDPSRAAAALERATEVLRTRISYGPVAEGEREGFLRALLAATSRR